VVLHRSVVHYYHGSFLLYDVLQSFARPAPPAPDFFDFLLSRGSRPTFQIRLSAGYLNRAHLTRAPRSSVESSSTRREIYGSGITESVINR
jgi:hypothetical protein